MGKIYMIGAMKGGVGKSVSVFNLAYSLQKKGKKVLAVDFDPQSNLTTCFGAEDVDVTKDTVRNWIKKTDIPAHKIGKLWKFKKSEIDEWIKSGKSALQN